MRRRSRGDGFHITKVGLWYGVFLLIVVAAATNTGNNGLFLVLAVMGGVAVVSEVAGRLNVRGLEVSLAAPDEIFANSPARLGVTLFNRSRFVPRWLLVVAVGPAHVEPAGHLPAKRTRPHVVSHLERRSSRRGHLEVLVRRRGRLRVRWVHLTSLFPLGFFRHGRRYASDLELLVFPEIFAPSARSPAQLGHSGDEPTRRPGWGHELLGLRAFRPGDDTRNIHWKQTAKTGELIFKERETEENRRLLIVFDNATGELASAAARLRFERLVSEAATAALGFLDSGYEVSLLTREGSLPFSSGARQRLAILEALALIEPRPAATSRLAPRDHESPHMRLAIEPEKPPAREVVA